MTVEATPAQEALWWIHHRAEHKDVYNLTWRLTVSGLDPAVLRRAWQLVVDRHAALRTGFVRQDGRLTRVVREHVAADLLVVSWPTAVPGVREVSEALHARPFDLADAPLARAGLITAAGEQELVLTVHHAVLDGWALQLVVTDLETAYLALAAGAEPEFPPLADAAPAAPTSADLAYWTESLRGARGQRIVPDREAAGTGTDGAVLRHQQPGEVTAAVAATAARVGCTPFAVQLAAIRTVLARGGATGRTAIGVVVANRMTPAEQRAVDYRANIVLLADEVAPGEDFDAVAARSRDALWESLPHQHVTFAEVYAGLTPADRAALGDIPPVVVTHHGRIGSGLTLGGRSARLLASPSTSARCQLLIGLFEDQAGTTVEIEYNAAELDGSTVRRFLSDVDGVLTGRPGAGTRAGWTPHTAPATVETRSSDDVWERVLGTRPAPDDDFFRLGGNSLQVLELIAEVEARTGARIDVAEWLDDPTPARLAALTATAVLPEAPPSSLHTMAPGDPGGPHLHLVHGAGVGRVPYRALVAALPPDWRVTVSEDTGAAAATIDDLAKHYLADLDSIPDVLAGWSMGGLVVHAMATQLGPAAPPVVLLDAPFPGSLPAPVTAGSFMAAVLRAAGLPELIPDLVEGSPDSVSALLAGLLGQPSAALRERHDLFHRHHTASRGYTGPEELTVPALLVTAELPESAVAQWRRRFPELTEVRVDADHYTLLGESAVTPVVAQLLRWRAA